jgi:hypothetical protein
MREANLTLRVFCVCSACVVLSVTHHVWVLSVAGGVVHANVGQKLVICDILRVFTVSQNRD